MRLHVLCRGYCIDLSLRHLKSKSRRCILERNAEIGILCEKTLHESNDSEHTSVRNRTNIRAATSLYTEQLIITRFGIKYNRRGGALLLPSFGARVAHIVRCENKSEQLAQKVNRVFMRAAS